MLTVGPSSQRRSSLHRRDHHRLLANLTPSLFLALPQLPKGYPGCFACSFIPAMPLAHLAAVRDWKQQDRDLLCWWSEEAFLEEI